MLVNVSNACTVYDSLFHLATVWLQNVGSVAALDVIIVFAYKPEMYLLTKPFMRVPMLVPVRTACSRGNTQSTCMHSAAEHPLTNSAKATCILVIRIQPSVAIQLCRMLVLCAQGVRYQLEFPVVCVDELGRADAVRCFVLKGARCVTTHLRKCTSTCLHIVFRHVGKNAQ